MKCSESVLAVETRSYLHAEAFISANGRICIHGHPKYPAGLPTRCAPAWLHAEAAFHTTKLWHTASVYLPQGALLQEKPSSLLPGSEVKGAADSAIAINTTKPDHMRIF